MKPRQSQIKPEGSAGQYLKVNPTADGWLYDSPLGLPLGLTGATAPTRYVGGTTSGHPTSGTFAVGDFVVTADGHIWVCTAAGTPGTWTDVNGSGGSGGYATVQDEGSALTARSVIDFTGAGVTASDDAANSRTVVNIPGGTSTGYSVVEDEGTALTARTAIDFQGAGVSATDDATNGKTVVTIPGSGSGSSEILCSTRTAAYTLALSDAETCVEMNSSSDVTVTVPTHATVPLSVGTWIKVRQLGAGQVSIAGASGVTIRTPDGVRTKGVNATVFLHQRATDDWVLGENLSDFASFVQQVATGGVGTSLNTVTFTTSAAAAAGHTLLMAVRVGFGLVVSSVTDSAGNTWHVDQTSPATGATVSLCRAYLATALAAGSSITVTFTGTGAGNSIAWQVLEYANLPSTVTIDATASQSASATTTMTVGPTGTLSQTNEFAVTAVASATISSPAPTQTAAGWTTRASNVNADGAVALADRVTSQTTALSASWSWTGLSNAGAVVVTYRY